jgi:AraC family transcriptional regulator
MSRSAPPPVRRARLAALPEFDVNLIHYAAGHTQSRHEHSRASCAIVLAGSLTEEVDSRDHRAGPGQLSLKPGRIAHADRYGHDGAILLSFVFRCEQTADEAIGRRGWQWRTMGSVTPNLTLSEPRSSLDDVLWDWLATTDIDAPSGQPPAWLRWAKSELDRQDSRPDIASLAKDAGVHRVHFTRQFARYFGLSPSIYRQLQMAARAVSAMVDQGQSPATAAADAGFADQSHMARAIRAAFGTTPRRIALLLAG